MNLHGNINFKRLLNLLSNDLRLNFKTILIAILALTVVLILLPSHLIGTEALYFLILYVGGFLLTSYAFNELHDRQKAHFFLMLPCTNLERFINKWLLTSVLYTLGTLLFYSIFTSLYGMINLLLFKHKIHVFNLFHLDLWIHIAKYIILQSIFFLGAAFFKRNALIKTSLTVGCFFLLIGVFTIVLSWIMCPTCFFKELFFVINSTFKGVYFIFWIILAPLCWYLAYLRLTESELL